MLDKRASDAPAPDRAHSIFPHVLDANIDALNDEVGRTGPDLKPLLDYEWRKNFVAGVIDLKTTGHRERGRGCRPDQGRAGIHARRTAWVGTDCGLINLPRMIAQPKFRALADGAAIVRAELLAKR